MKKLIVVLITILIYACNSSLNLNNNESKYFEGIITCKIDYKPYSNLFTSELLKEIVGEKLIIRFKEGVYKKEYYSSNGELLSERYLDLNENKLYSKSINNDTVFWVDITKNDSKTTFIKLKDTTILEQSAIGIKAKTIVKMDMFPDTSFNVGGTYYYSKKHLLNPVWYEGYEEGNYNEIISVGKGINLLSITDELYWEKIVTTVEIKEKSINSEKLKIKINDSTPLIEL